jgi:ankyrin repeat protein
LGIESHSLLHIPSVVEPFLDSPDAHGWTALHWATNYGAVDDVSILINLGCKVTARNNQEEMPLHLPCSEQQTSCARALLAAGAPVNAIAHEYGTPLHYVGYGSGTPSRELIELLINSGAEVDSDPGGVGCTALHCACTHLAAVRTLVQDGMEQTLSFTTSRHRIYMALIEN